MKDIQEKVLMSRNRCWVEIDLDLIKHNVNEIYKSIPKHTKIMAIIKANAYGHGDVVLAKELKKYGVDFFGVSSIDEAIWLRKNGIKESILVLGYTPSCHFSLLKEYQVIQTVYSLEYATKLNGFAKEHNFVQEVHIKIDTGMGRLGFLCNALHWNIEEVKSVYAFANLHVQGIFSHFSVSDSLNTEDIRYTECQIQFYDRVLEELKSAGISYGLTHLQNSYGILNYPSLTYDYVRPGLLYLGVYSNASMATNVTMNLKPIMSWKASVSLVKEIEANTYLSYGRNYCASKKRVIATVSCGYADGYPRSLSNKNQNVLIHGKFATIVGNICMDQMLIDVTDIPSVKEGDEVVLFGESCGVVLPIDALSTACETINNETLCWISSRVPRIYITSKNVNKRELENNETT